MYNAPKERKMTKVYSNCGFTSISDCKRLKSIVWKSEKNTSLTGSHYSKKIQEKQCAARIRKITFFSRILCNSSLDKWMMRITLESCLKKHLTGLNHNIFLNSKNGKLLKTFILDFWCELSLALIWYNFCTSWTIWYLLRHLELA